MKHGKYCYPNVKQIHFFHQLSIGFLCKYSRLETIDRHIVFSFYCQTCLLGHKKGLYNINLNRSSISVSDCCLTPRKQSFNHFMLRTSYISMIAVAKGFEARSGQTKDYKIGICCFSTKHAVLRNIKSKDWLARNQDNIPESSTKLLVQYKADTIVNSYRMKFVLAIIQLKNCSFGVKQQSLALMKHNLLY